MATKTITKGKTGGSAKGSAASAGPGTGSGAMMNFKKVYATNELLDLIDHMDASTPMKGRNDHFFPLEYYGQIPNPWQQEFLNIRLHDSGLNPTMVSFGYDPVRLEGSNYPISVQLTPTAAANLEKFDEGLKNKWLDKIEANSANEEFKALAGPLVAPAKGGVLKVKSREVLESEWQKSPLVKDGNEKALAAGKKDTNYPKSLKIKILGEDVGGTKKTVLQKARFVEKADGTGKKVLTKPEPLDISAFENPVSADGGGVRMLNAKVLMTLGISRNAIYIGGTGAGISIIARAILLIEGEETEDGPGVDLAGVEILEEALDAGGDCKMEQQKGALSAMDAAGEDPYCGIDG